MSTLKPDQIADIVGFDQGDKFESPDEVREYFQLATMRNMYEWWDEEKCVSDITQGDLDRAAEWVIDSEEHCDFTETIEERYYRTMKALEHCDSGEGSADWDHVAELHAEAADLARQVAVQIEEFNKKETS